MTYEKKQAILGLLDSTNGLRQWLHDENIEAIRQLCIKEDLDKEEEEWLFEKLHAFAFPFKEKGGFKHTWAAKASWTNDVAELLKKKGLKCEVCGQSGYYPKNQCVVCFKKADLIPDYV